MENARDRVPNRSGASGDAGLDQLGYRKESRFAKPPHVPVRPGSLGCTRGTDRSYAPGIGIAP